MALQENEKMHRLNLTDDIIDIRDVIERYEFLEGAGYNLPISGDSALIEECKQLTSLLDDLAGAGGDEQWRDEWYPLGLIKDSHFVEHTKELLVDCGFIPKDFPAWIAIDWEKTADSLKDDYNRVTVGENDYWYR
jgi:hypothetical protein